MVKNFPANEGDIRDFCLIPASGRSPEGGHDKLPIWRIPWTEKPGKLQPMGWQRVGHALACAHISYSLVTQTVKNMPAMWETWV